MEKLLKWSVDAQSGGKNLPPPDAQQLAQLFGAPDDVAQMHIELQGAAAGAGADLDQRVAQLEAFHDHVENVDNANNIGKLWAPLVALIDDPEPEIRQLALASIAAAVQNNAKSQLELAAQPGAVARILARAHEPGTAKQALHALASALAHCADVYDQFAAAGGWDALHTLFTTYVEGAGPAPVRGRVLSLLAALAITIEERADIAKPLRSFETALRALQASSGADTEKIETVLSGLALAKPVPQIEDK